MASARAASKPTATQGQAPAGGVPGLVLQIPLPGLPGASALHAGDAAPTETATRLGRTLHSRHTDMLHAIATGPFSWLALPAPVGEARKRLSDSVRETLVWAQAEARGGGSDATTLTLRDPLIGRLLQHYLDALHHWREADPNAPALTRIELQFGPLRDAARALEGQGGLGPTGAGLLVLRHALEAERFSRDHTRVVAFDAGQSGAHPDDAAPGGVGEWLDAASAALQALSAGPDTGPDTGTHTGSGDTAWALRSLDDLRQRLDYAAPVIAQILSSSAQEARGARAAHDALQDARTQRLQDAVGALSRETETLRAALHRAEHPDAQPDGPDARAAAHLREILDAVEAAIDTTPAPAPAPVPEPALVPDTTPVSAAPAPGPAPAREIARLDERAATAQRRLDKVRRERDELLEERRELREGMNALRRSTSWRLTRPLRWLSARLSGGSGQ